MTIAESTKPTPSGGKQGATRPRLVKSWYNRYERYLLGIAGLAVLVAAWQALAQTGAINLDFFSEPSQIASSMVQYFQHGTGWEDLAVSGKEFAIGFGLSLLIGIPVGIALGWYHRLDALLDGVISGLYNAPRIALAPLFVIWLGIGTPSKVAVVILSSIFPIIISARSGVQEASRSLTSMARSFGAGHLRVLSSVVLPGSIPSISSGIRIAIAQGLLGVVLAEYIASTGGLGYTVVTAASQLATPRLFDAVIVITVIGILLTEVFRGVENYFSRWRVLSTSRRRGLGHARRSSGSHAILNSGTTA
jgi:ABC-type nitrate/sulfonate/bicarbonate transport system permease component